MTDPPQNHASTGHDPTRDITLPPMADRPPSALPREWAGLGPAAPAAETPDFSAPPPPLPAHDEVEPAAPGPHSIVADQPTDQLAPPPRPRERTLAFSSPEMSRRPVSPVQVGRTSRRWPWVVLTLLPILIIAGAAVAWLVLIRTM
jgi:hypothetical protein